MRVGGAKAQILSAHIRPKPVTLENYASLDASFNPISNNGSNVCKCNNIAVNMRVVVGKRRLQSPQQ